jgi:photosystem II stability/assembly factor-like uncharacterized protein
MRKLILLFLVLSSSIAVAQNLRWVKLNTFPQRTTRRDDFCFINSQTGWVIDEAGYVYKTRDGGYTWNQKNIGGIGRCIGFADSLHGFAGTYDIQIGGLAPLFKTSDGGNNWTAVTNIPAPSARGFCGIHCVNENVIYIVGRIDGPPRLIKSTNGGDSWINTNIDTSLASRLVDVKFFTPDSGFVTGGKGPYNSSSPIILFTSDGGATWANKFTGTNLGSYQSIWKISFANRNFGVASFNQQSTSLQFIKTTDGGMSWNPITQIINPSLFTQGIGFINENVGWIGGGANCYMTTNGGANWTVNTFGTDVNRIRFYSDTLGYASGAGFYKYTADVNIKVNENFSIVPDNFKLYQNYPNPFNPLTVINYFIPKTSIVKIIVHDITGKEIRTLKNGASSAGPYQTFWDGRNDAGVDAPSGIYYLSLASEGYKETRKMVLVR